MPLVCCQLVRKGRYTAAEPWFDDGSGGAVGTIALGDAKAHRDDVGKLAMVAAQRTVGRVVEVLGPVDSVHAALRGLLAQEGLLGPVPAPGRELGEPSSAVQRQLDELDDAIPDLASREDLRGELVVTIDPPGAKDFDDAIGLEAAPAGADHAWRLWVHIADVAAYVPPGSPIDVEAQDRAMSAYVPGAVAPMLPHRLSSDLCSLRPGVDRGCVSVCCDLADDGSVVRTRFARSVIRSARRLTYEQVDALLEEQSAGIDPLVDALLHRLDEVTAVLRQRRMRRGALDMALPEVEVELGELVPSEARLALESRSHRLVEECMLVANEAVGLRLAQAQAPGMWRVHEHPEPESIVGLFATFERLGVPTPPLPETFGGSEAARLAVAAAKLAREYSERSGRGRVAFAPRVLRALQRADYRARTGPHSGLATEHYAHFTSPIRRYPDLVNHRSLLRLLGIADEEPATVDLDPLAEHVSVVERELQDLERRADRIALAYLLHRRLHSGEQLGDEPDPAREGLWRGEVTGMVGGGLFVRFGGVFEGFVPARTLSPDERYELDDFGLAMVGARSGHAIRLGDAMEVRLERVDRASGRIDLRRAGRTPPAGGGRPGEDPPQRARPGPDQPGGAGRRRRPPRRGRPPGRRR